MHRSLICGSGLSEKERQSKGTILRDLDCTTSLPPHGATGPGDNEAGDRAASYTRKKENFQAYRREDLAYRGKYDRGDYPRSP